MVHFKRARSILGLTIAVVGVGTLLVLAHGGDSSVVHACVHNANKSVRIVGPQQTCQSNETAVHWSIQGPAGAVGPQGPAGQPGASGPIGPAGPPGLGNFVVRDANGTLVGAIIPAEYANSQGFGLYYQFVVHTIGNSRYVLTLQGSDSEPGPGALSAIYFESSDCTGPALIQGFGHFRGLLAVGSAGQQPFDSNIIPPPFYGQTGPAFETVAHSRLSGGCSSGAQPGTYFPASPISVPSFALPLSVD